MKFYHIALFSVRFVWFHLAFYPFSLYLLSFFLPVLLDGGSDTIVEVNWPFEMNGDGHMEIQYINTGFPYSVTESFMDFFEGFTHVPANYTNFAPMFDQVGFFLTFTDTLCS